MGFRPEFRINIEVSPIRQFAHTAGQRAQELAYTHETLCKLLQDAREKQKYYYNRHRQPRTFKIGDWVTVNAKNISTVRPSPKLEHRRIGPFQIIHAWGKQAYHLQLTPRYARLHHVFHFEYLEPYHSRDSTFPAPEGELIDGELQFEVKILDKRVRRDGSVQYLVHWAGYPPSEDT